MKITFAGLMGVAALFADPALAHHSHSMFDHTKEVTVTGTVSGYAFRNPHGFLYVDVKGESGQMVTWWIEMSNISNMLRSGMTKDSFKEGDVVTVTMHPLSNGKPGGNQMKIVTAAGKVYD
jgi:hypothetical protein